MADQTSARAIIRISAVPDSGLQRALKGTVDAARRAQNDVAKGQQKADRQAQASAARLAKWKTSVEINSAKMAQRAQEQRVKAQERADRQRARSEERIAKQLARAEERLGKQAQRQTESTERYKLRVRLNSLRAAQRAEEQAARSSERLERRKIQIQLNSARIHERVMRQQARESERAARSQIRDAQRQFREHRAAARNRRDNVLRGAALVGGAAAATMGRVRSFQGAFGVQSPEQMAAQAVEFRRRSVLLSDMGGISPEERKQLEQRILATSARTGVDAGQILGGLEVAHDRFSGLETFSTIIDDLANISVATGASVESVVGAMGVMRRQFDLSEEEMLQLGGAMVQAADLGNISFQDVADNFAAALGSMGRNAHLQGIGGAKQALGITQLLGTSDMSPSEAATLGTRVIGALNDVKVQEKLAKSRKQGGFGINVTKDGKLGTELRPIADIIEEMALKGFMHSSFGARRQQIFTEERSQRGIEVLVSAFDKNPMEAAALLGLDSSEGQEAVKRRVAAMNEGTVGQAATMGARQFKEFFSGKQFENYLDIAVKSADSLAKLEAQYPLMTEAVGISTEALKAFGAMVLAQVLMGRVGRNGTAGLSSIGLPTSLPTPAANGPISVGPVAGTSELAQKIAVAGRSLEVFSVAFAATTAVLKLTGLDKKIEETAHALHEFLHPGDRKAGAEGPSNKRADRNVELNQHAQLLDEASGKTHVRRPRMAYMFPEDLSAEEELRKQEEERARRKELQASIHVIIDGPGHVTKVKSSGGDVGFDVSNGPMSGSY